MLVLKAQDFRPTVDSGRRPHSYAESTVSSTACRLSSGRRRGPAASTCVVGVHTVQGSRATAIAATQ